MIIDKLPFASPGDPITAARIEAINAEGGDAFEDYQVPLAILALLQGLGRLIRHRTDRGVLAVLDPAAADDGLRPPVPRLVPAGAGDPESRGDRAVFRKLIYTLTRGGRHRAHDQTRLARHADVDRAPVRARRWSGRRRRLAQSTMVKGKVVDAKKASHRRRRDHRRVRWAAQPQADDQDRQEGRVRPAADRVGHVPASPRPTQARHGQQRCRASRSARRREVNIVLAPATGRRTTTPKAAELKKVFEEGVAASRANNHDGAIEKFNGRARACRPTASTATSTSASPTWQKKDEKQAEEAWKKALELKPDYAEALNALSTLYNNQKRFDEAAAMSAKAAAAGGGGGGSADAIFNQGIILWNQGKIAEAKAKFEEAIKAEPEPRRRALPARHGAAERRQAPRSGRGVRELREARARRPVRRRRPRGCSRS